VRFERSDLNDEGVRTKVLALNDKARHEDAVRGRLAETAGPPLDARVCGRVEHKLVRGLVIDRKGLESTDERAVAQLGLGVRANDLGSTRVSATTRPSFGRVPHS